LVKGTAKSLAKSLTPAGDWLDTLITPGGLPLIVSQLYFAILVFILWVGLEEDKQQNLDVCEKDFYRVTEHLWTT
jgi:hypothetical protein